MKLAVLIGVLVLAIAGAAVAADLRTKPALRVADRSPVTVAGTAFVSRERVLVTVSSSHTWTRRATAGARGTFRVVFEGATVDRCEVVRVVATGARGSRATLKLLPQPACNPA